MNYTFHDILKSDFLEQVGSFSPLDMILALLLSFALGLFIYFVYRKSFNGIMYSANFGLSLIAMCMITSVVILTISSNIILSLGMVGALSIVRFRAAIKEPLDIVFLFWSVAAGLVAGAGFIPLAVFSSLVIGIVLVLFANHKTVDTPFIFIVNCTDDTAEQEIMQQLQAKTSRSALKAKTVREANIELTWEVRLHAMQSQFVNEISALEGVKDAVLVSYNGEYMS